MPVKLKDIEGLMVDKVSSNGGHDLRSQAVCQTHNNLIIKQGSKSIGLNQVKLELWLPDNIWRFRDKESKGIDCIGLSKAIIAKEAN